MRDIRAPLKRLVTSWRGDLLLAALMIAWTVAYLGLIAPREDRRWIVLLYGLPFAAALALRRRWPVAAAALACAALLAVRPLGLVQNVGGALGLPFTWMPFLLAYGLGTSAGLATGLASAALLAVSVQLSNTGAFNPIFEMMTIGPWLAGRIMASRRKITAQLEARNDELQAEQELFALESVRYERARIARELHDIVAHCLSVVVVQASAGQRIGRADRAGVTEALESVAEAAGQAQAEIGSLVELLAGALPSDPSPRLPMIGELVARASATGLAVTCHFLGNCDQMPAAASEAAYRLVQEALTNSLKHAPGAPVDITVRGQDGQFEVDIVNGASHQRPTGLERFGGSYGLAGMRERVAACGGQLTSGPTAAGGWLVSAALPGGETVMTYPTSEG
jgi:signal transduction histidine kinase